MSPDDFDATVSRLATLAEPVRRALYRYVAGQREPVSREHAAAGVGVPHHLAKFHLDKLVRDGLLEAEYRRPPGRGGPGAGRPAKLYRRAAGQLAVSLPERRYDLAGHILAEAVTTARRAGASLDGALSAAARAAGRELAARGGDVTEVLASAGFEPRGTEEGVVLGNCPFHRLARSHPALVCGINLDLIGGLLDALPGPRPRARLAPAAGRCCVTIGGVTPRPRSAG